ncbi:MAG: hypothetical protein Q7T13_01600 [Polaromonas sp.]|nr:hypothetical protein [Polaromonas sp.]
MTSRQEPVPAWAAPAGAAIIFLLLICLVIAIYPGWPSIGTWMDKSDSPAWVQAVGSILAIVFSAVFVVVQHRLEIQRQKQADIDARLRKLGVIVELARAMASATTNLLPYFPSYLGFQDRYLNGELPPIDILNFNDVLEPIPLYELDSGAVVNEVIVLQKNCSQFSRLVKVLIQDPMKLHPESFELGKQNLVTIAAECHKSYQKLKLNRNAVEQERYT